MESRRTDHTDKVRAALAHLDSLAFRANRALEPFIVEGERTEHGGLVIHGGRDEIVKAIFKGLGRSVFSEEEGS